MSDWEKVGFVYVDAGMVWLGDPCYTLDPKGCAAVNTWDEFCQRLSNCDGEGGNHHMIGHSSPLGEGMGMAISSGYGDGEYPVMVRYTPEGRVAALKIEFITEDQDA